MLSTKTFVDLDTALIILSNSYAVNIALRSCPPIWAIKHYVWATKFPFLGAQVTTKTLTCVCSTEIDMSRTFSCFTLHNIISEQSLHTIM